MNIVDLSVAGDNVFRYLSTHCIYEVIQPKIQVRQAKALG